MLRLFSARPVTHRFAQGKTACFATRKSATASATPELPQKYDKLTCWFHAVTAFCMIGCVGQVLQAQSLPAWPKCTPEEKAKKTECMWRHKSLGTLLFLMWIPRLAWRLRRVSPAEMPGVGQLMSTLGQLSHALMYVFIVGLPTSGVLMTASGGGKLPFFFTEIDTQSLGLKDKERAGLMYKVHTTAGQAFEYYLPLHIAAAFGHLALGHPAFGRILNLF